ncbi:hypothetical protein C9374_009876 [Naegleria lovaniensis]|uniref:Uncharacterized protein n=1 Tax=Naegleria lovaniensis TaxID=51637 RepID=A0AA88GI03_NAELO|nr:uncharacterized protein C9374_009876 [Naegleria lovaniensis]KAG2375253.1 hypothetical protein C9374_009876 [Naegleria lovaniensis]
MYSITTFSIFIIISAIVIAFTHHSVHVSATLKLPNHDSPSTPRSSPDLNKIIQLVNKLTLDISNEQSQKDLPFRSFPIQFAEQQGLFKSYIHMNNAGSDLKSTLLRRYAKIPDLNMFVTNFVVLAQIESQYLIENSKYRKQLSDVLEMSSLDIAIQAILSYHDNNFNASVPVYNFWPQRLLSNSKYYQAFPVNLVEPMTEFGSIEKYLEEVLKALHLDVLLEDIEDLAASFQFLAQAFHIPADYDDTSCNLALGSMLYKYIRNKNPNLYDKWNSKNSNIHSLFNVFEQFSYSPSSAKQVPPPSFNTILDSRSYYIFHNFLEQNPNIRLPMTWLMNTKQDRDRYPAVAQPFNVNNIDLSVLTNFLFGISSHAIHRNEFELNNHPMIQQMMLNASEIIRYALMNDIEMDRPDLSLVYYPSVYDFYWFISRTSFLLRNSQYSSNNVLSTISNTLYKSLTTYVTPKIIKLAQSTSNGNEYYWDDFLGDFKDKKYGEDRLFSTSLALSALLDTWTDEYSSSSNNNNENGIKQRRFNPNTPTHVKTLISGGIIYLQENLFAFLASHENAFFSGSVKGSNDYPYWYPSNYCEYLNGTKIRPVNQDDITSELIVGVEGIIEPSKLYDQMLKEKWFNMTVPTQFHGFANEGFPFWSSPALTFSMSQLVFSKWLNMN